MWQADALTVAGLLIDVAGAVLIIGTDWRVVEQFGERVNPGLRMGKMRMIAEIQPQAEPLHDGFHELFDAVDIRDKSDRFERESISFEEEDNSTRTVVKFRFKSDDSGENPDFAVDPETVKSRAETYKDRWFIRRGVTVLMIGFGVQIVATLIPYAPV